MKTIFISAKKRFLFIVFLFASGIVFAQSPSIKNHIRFSVWAELDAYPGTLEAKENMDDDSFEYQRNRIKEITPFLMEGLVYGWNFVYTPSDKARGVEEYMQITPIYENVNLQNQIEYSQVQIDDERIYCWVDLERTEAQVQNYLLWNSIQHPSISGKGYGDLSKGFEGIKEAVQDSVKNAVHDYYQQILRNKPKEISGQILLRKTPIIGIDSGRYSIILDFFLECVKIKEYTQF